MFGIDNSSCCIVYERVRRVIRDSFFHLKLLDSSKLALNKVVSRNRRLADSTCPSFLGPVLC
jgi:hypothetical protein